MEKGSPERMLELVAEVDGRPLSRWGCDGVVFATPTGSTAYAFSAGGPDRLARGRGAAARPDQRACACSPDRLVVSPDSVLAVERPRRTTRGRASCGATAGARWSCRPAPGSRCAAASCPVLLARLHRRRSPTGWSRKFDLPVRGWRGSAVLTVVARRLAPVLEEIRIRGLGVIDDAVLPARRRPDRHHRRDRRRQDDGRDRSRPALRRARRRRAVRPASGHGARRGPAAHRTRRSGGPAGGRRRRRARRRRPPAGPVGLGRRTSRAHVGGRAVPVGVLAELAEICVAVHGQSDQPRLLRRAASARHSTATPATPSDGRWAATPPPMPSCGPLEDELAELTHAGPGAGPGGRPAAVRARGDRGGRPAGRRGRRPGRTRRTGSPTPTPCAVRPARPARRSSVTPRPATSARRRGHPGEPRRPSASSRRAATTPRWPSSPAACARSATWWPTSPPTWPPTSPASRPTPPGWRRSGAPRRHRPADPQVRRQRGRGARLGAALGRPARPRSRVTTSASPCCRSERARCSTSSATLAATVSAARGKAAVAVRHGRLRRAHRPGDAAGQGRGRRGADREPGRPRGGRPAARVRRARRRRRRDAAVPAPRCAGPAAAARRVRR